MNILGISAGFHDAALSLVDLQGNILFASHSERYSGVKNQADIDPLLLKKINFNQVGTIAYYERPWLKQSRQIYSGQGVEFNKLTVNQILKSQLGQENIRNKKIVSYQHHLSHAAAGFQTSNFDRATVVVIDAIGEWDSVSIWAAEYINEKPYYKKLWSKKYPNSIGLFYSAMTQRVNLKPMEDEYILMGMSAYGNKKWLNEFKHLVCADEWNLDFTQNFHLGSDNPELEEWHSWDIAGCTQALAENLIYNVMRRARSYNWSENLVYMGGVALNCLANTELFNYFSNIWIMPNPGDAGSSLGAAALALNKKLNWKTAFLGEDIPGTYPVNAILDELLENKIVGVASGRAEFGPRALGNRSLLADPRGKEIKNLVNDIKQRQKFRPFAPVILEEMLHDYFELPCGQSRYMQFVAKCKHPDLYPAIAHIDETSRVQTVPKDGSGIRELLEKWYVITGCPMLLNTSLNIKGEPIVNTREDADRFQNLYNVKVLS
jgi:carbamoyltransferase